MGKDPKMPTAKEVKAKFRGRAMNANYEHHVKMRDARQDREYKERREEFENRGHLRKQWANATLERQSLRNFTLAFLVLYPLGFLFSPILIWALVVNIKGISAGIEFLKKESISARIGLALNSLLLVGGVLGGIASIRFWLELWNVI